MMKITVSINEQGQRLDKALAMLSPYSRSKAAHMMKSGHILLNGRKAKANMIVYENDEIIINPGYKKKNTHIAQVLPLDIVYEDKHILVVNKAYGQVVHPSKGHYQDTLYNGLLAYFNAQDNHSWGIVHRLDKDTSGLLVIAKSEEDHDFLARQLLDKTMLREYLALVEGNLDTETTVQEAIGQDPDNPKLFIVNGINPKKACTIFSPVQSFNGYSLVSCQLKTGRTHQIRVHAKTIQHPLYGDPLYNPSAAAMFLCARKLSFIHPYSQEPISFTIDLPDDFKAMIKQLL